MNDLVFLDKGVPVVRTFDIFERFGYAEHRLLKRVISDNEEMFTEDGFLHLEVQKPTSKNGGRPTESYLLNEDQFITLVLLAKNTNEAKELKMRVKREFKRMKNKLAEMASDSLAYTKVRRDGISVYHQKTDVIKEFVDYAISQGSSNAKRYYENLAGMENKALFIFEQKYKNLREVLTIKQLMQVATADQLIENAIKEGLANELHYKEIFQLAKERVIKFAEIIGKSQILSLEKK